MNMAATEDKTDSTQRRRAQNVCSLLEKMVFLGLTVYFTYKVVG